MIGNDVPENPSVLNKAFYFNPIAEHGDGTYRNLVKYFKSFGFEPKYSTPDNTDDDTAIGLYTYRNLDGELSYVFTSELHEDEDYEMHIRGFADNESKDGGENLEVVDARDFVRNL